MFGLLSSSCCEDSSRRFGHCTLWPSSGDVREVVVDSLAIAMKESPVDGRKTLLKKLTQNSWILHVCVVNKTSGKSIQPERKNCVSMTGTKWRWLPETVECLLSRVVKEKVGTVFVSLSGQRLSHHSCVSVCKECQRCQSNKQTGRARNIRV